MAQRGRPKKIFTEEKNIFLTEEKNLKIDNSPRVNTSDVEIVRRGNRNKKSFSIFAQWL